MVRYNWLRYFHEYRFLMLNSYYSRAVVNVSLPVAFGLWFMMYPVLVKVRWEDFGHLLKLRDTYMQMGFSLLANWVRFVIYSHLRPYRTQTIFDNIAFSLHPLSTIRS